MNRSFHSAKFRRAHSGSRQVWTVIAIGACLGLGAFGADRLMISVHSEAAAAAVAASGDDEIYTGSILYMPDRGNLCRQLLFDNHNGQFTDNGYVDCERAAYRGSFDGPKKWSAARVQVISTGFRGE
jgi:hypothetical protein